MKGDGTVVAWGDNFEGVSTVPAGLSGVIAIDAGDYHNLVVKAVTDATAPAVTCVTPAPQFVVGEIASVSAMVTDTESGPAAASVTAAADTATVGARSANLTGSDLAGNTATIACPYTVRYGADQQHFFAEPVDNAAVNRAKSSKVIPVRWRLTRSDGTPITNLTAATVTSARANCAIGLASDAIEEYARTTGPTLQHLGNGVYQYNWKPIKKWAGTCRTMTLDLGEGITHTATFRFTS